MPPELLADSAFLKIKYLLTRGGGHPGPSPAVIMECGQLDSFLHNSKE